MAQIPNEPTSREPIRAEWGRQVVRMLRDLDRRLRAIRPKQEGKKGSSVAALQPFQLVTRVDSTDPEDVHYFIRVVYSTIDGVAPDGFSPGDDPIFEEDVTAGSDTGKLWLHVTYDPDTGAITLREEDFGETVPDDDSGEVYEELGSYVIDRTAKSITAANAGYGPAYLCRDWFSNPATYSIDLQS